MPRFILFVVTALAITCNVSAAHEFVHPGILVSKAQLRFVAANKDREPWATFYQAALKSPLASLDYTATPREIVNCGSKSEPDEGCTDETNDAQAAYLHALLWSYNGDTRHAEKVREIFKAWTGTLKGHTGSNAALQASWAAQLFTRAAEIVKYSYSGWPQSEKDAVTRMFAEQYVRYADQMFTGPLAGRNNNWQASALEALVNIAVFNKNEKLFYQSISRWKSLLASYIYLEWDGGRPIDTTWYSRTEAQVRTSWYSPTRYINGMPREFCRDLPHTGYGVAALINVAETARIQGLDLYQEHAERLMAGMETLAKYSLDFQDQTSDYKEICNKPVSGWPRGTLFIGYNHYANRLGKDLPYTKAFIDKHPEFPGHFHYQWERLTHYMVSE